MVNFLNIFSSLLQEYGTLHIKHMKYMNPLLITKASSQQLLIVNFSVGQKLYLDF